MATDAGIEADLEALAVEHRYACTAAERRMLEVVRDRLPAGTASRAEGLVAHPLPLLILGVHGILMLGSGAFGWWYPGLGALGCLLVTFSLLGEGTGRAALLRVWLPAQPSYNLVVPPAAGAEELGSVVIAVPMDVPRARAPKIRWWRRPALGVFASGILLTGLLLLRAVNEPLGRALTGLYALSLAVSAAAATGVFLARREPRRASADAGGPAAALELYRRFQQRPLPGVHTWFVFTGAGRAHQEGMTTFLQLRGERLPRPVLVLSLQDVGQAPLQAVVTEGPLWPQHHRPTGPALVERLRWAGVRLPLLDRPEPSDARAAMLLGYRALGLAGGGGESTPDGVRRAADVAETMLRWYRDDLARLPSDRSEVARWAGEPATTAQTAPAPPAGA